MKSVTISILAALFLLTSVAARADSISIFGSGSEVGDIGGAFGFRGPGLEVNSGPVGYPDDFIAGCEIGTFCALGQMIPGLLEVEDINNQLDQVSGGSFLGQVANGIGGALTFSGGLFIPSDSSGGSISFPITVSGTIQGYWYATDCPPDCSENLLWTFNVTGSGEGEFTGQLIGNGFVGVTSINYTFSGTASPLPEPPSFFLLATAMFGIGIALLRRRSREHWCE